MKISVQGRANLIGAMPGTITALESKLRFFEHGTRGWEEAGRETQGAYFRPLDEYEDLGVMVGFGQAEIDGDGGLELVQGPESPGQRQVVSGVLLRKKAAEPSWAGIGRECIQGKSLWDYVEPLVVVGERDCPELYNLTHLVYERVNQRRLESLPWYGEFGADIKLASATVEMKHVLAEEVKEPTLRSRMAGQAREI